MDYTIVELTTTAALFVVVGIAAYFDFVVDRRNKE